MNVRTSLIWLSLGILLAASTQALEALPFENKEQLRYHFYYGPFMVGRGVFQIERRPSKNKIWKCSVDVTSNHFVSSIYPVKDHLESDLDVVSNRSIRFEQNRLEGSHNVWEETWFFYPLKHAFGMDYHTGENHWYEIPSNAVQDKLSTIYSMRLLDWSSRTEAAVTLASDKGNQVITMRKTGEETLVLDDLGSIPSMIIQPDSSYLGGFVKNGKMQVWVSRDKRLIPVKVVSKHPFGTISAVLVSVENVPGWSQKP